jgi:hypothetical protein
MHKEYQNLMKYGKLILKSAALVLGLTISQMAPTLAHAQFPGPGLHRLLWHIR